MASFLIVKSIKTMILSISLGDWREISEAGKRTVKELLERCSDGSDLRSGIMNDGSSNNIIMMGSHYKAVMSHDESLIFYEERLLTPHADMESLQTLIMVF